MRWHPLLVGLAYGLGAIGLALIVVLPSFYVLNLIYGGGKRLTPLMIAVVVAWGVLAWLLSRRRVRL